MTDHSERDEAARKYCTEGVFPAALPALESMAFTAGADWAVKNDPRVLKLVEALRHYSKLQDWKMLPVPAIEALAEWSKG